MDKIKKWVAWGIIGAVATTVLGLCLGMAILMTIDTGPGPLLILVGGLVFIWALNVVDVR